MDSSRHPFVGAPMSGRRLDIEIKDRFGHPVVPREWFLVPLFVVDEAVDKIKNGTIADYIYDPHTARLRRAGRDQTLA